jgi:hypothetical protein
LQGKTFANRLYLEENKKNQRFPRSICYWARPNQKSNGSGCLQPLQTFDATRIAR